MYIFIKIFFSADYWATTKTKCKGTADEKKCVIQAKIVCDEAKVIDFDNPIESKKYNQRISAYNELIKENKVSLDFSEGLDKEDEYYKNNLNKRISCYFKDLYQKDTSAEVFMYTFHKKSPKYSTGIFYIHGLSLEYNEKQICVFKPNLIQNISLCEEGYEIC